MLELLSGSDDAWSLEGSLRQAQGRLFDCGFASLSRNKILARDDKTSGTFFDDLC
jgi:hypothetical protein